MQNMLMCTVCILGMCISITDADAICISMHSQRYDTLNAIRFNEKKYDAKQFNMVQIVR